MLANTSTQHEYKRPSSRYIFSPQMSRKTNKSILCNIATSGGITTPDHNYTTNGENTKCKKFNEPKVRMAQVADVDDPN